MYTRTYAFELRLRGHVLAVRENRQQAEREALTLALDYGERPGRVEVHPVTRECRPTSLRERMMGA